MSRPFKPALQALLVNVVFSAVLISVSLGLLIFWFFPYPFIAVDDISTAVIMIVAVNLCIGPLLTFILYKPGKKGLLLDLSTVVVLQLAALIYGLYAVYDSRPAYLVFYGDSFYLTDHKQVDENALVDDTLKVGAWGRPKLVAALLPGDTQERMLIALESMASGKPLTTDASYFTLPNKLEKSQWFTLALKPKDIGNLPVKYHDKPHYALFHIVSSKAGLIAVFDTDKLAISHIFSSK